MPLSPSFCRDLIKTKLCSPMLVNLLERGVAQGWNPTVSYLLHLGLIQVYPGGPTPEQQKERYRIIDDWRREHGCPEWRIERRAAI